MSNDIRNMYLIVTTLIATTTYEAVLSSPGGFHQIDATGTNNTPILDHEPSNSSKVFEGKSVIQNITFFTFSTTNMCAFITSILTIILMMPRNVGWCLLYLPTSLLLISYSVSMMVISPVPVGTGRPQDTHGKIITKPCVLYDSSSFHDLEPGGQVYRSAPDDRRILMVKS